MHLEAVRRISHARRHSEHAHLASGVPSESDGGGTASARPAIRRQLPLSDPIRPPAPTPSPAGHGLLTPAAPSSPPPGGRDRGGAARVRCAVIGSRTAGKEAVLVPRRKWRCLWDYHAARRLRQAGEKDPDYGEIAGCRRAASTCQRDRG